MGASVIMKALAINTAKINAPNLRQESDISQLLSRLVNQGINITSLKSWQQIICAGLVLCSSMTGALSPSLAMPLLTSNGLNTSSASVRKFSPPRQKSPMPEVLGQTIVQQAGQMIDNVSKPKVYVEHSPAPPFAIDGQIVYVLRRGNWAEARLRSYQWNNRLGFRYTVEYSIDRNVEKLVAPSRIRNLTET